MKRRKKRRPCQHQRRIRIKKKGKIVGRKTITINKNLHYKKSLKDKPPLRKQFTSQPAQPSWMDENQNLRRLERVRDKLPQITKTVSSAIKTISLLHGNIFTNLINEGVKFTATIIIEELESGGVLDYIKEVDSFETILRQTIETILKLALKKMECYYKNIEIREKIEKECQRILVKEISNLVTSTKCDGLDENYPKRIYPRFKTIKFKTPKIINKSSRIKRENLKRGNIGWKKNREDKLKLFDNMFEIIPYINGKESIREDRLQKAISLIKQYSLKHKDTKLLISGSFLYCEKYNDIDIFIISKYKKEDYQEGRIHLNYLPESIEETLFFKSISAVSIANFKFEKNSITEEIEPEEIHNLFLGVTSLIKHNYYYLPELRDLILKTEYVSNRVVFSSMQLKTAADKIIRSRNPSELITEYLITKGILHR